MPLGRHTVTLLDAASLRKLGRVDVIVDGIRTADADRSLIALDLERKEQRVDFAVTPFSDEPLPRTSGRSILPAALLLAALTLRLVASRKKRRATRPVARR
ncbi:MAG: hypothetical protein DDT39_01698 [Firmicutes bacterium]|nr:hypothetical protein [candidate division NPL-UPA2 bacterium]